MTVAAIADEVNADSLPTAPRGYINGKGCPPTTWFAQVSAHGDSRLRQDHVTVASCIDWWSVDLYVNDANQVVGVDVNLGSPR